MRFGLYRRSSDGAFELIDEEDDTPSLRSITLEPGTYFYSVRKSESRYGWRDETGTYTVAFKTGPARVMPGEPKMYWWNEGRILRANLDGTEAEDIFAGRTTPGIFLDSHGGRVYWAREVFGDYSALWGIGSTNLDGSDARQDFVGDFDLLTQRGRTPLPRLIGVAAGRVYWGGSFAGYWSDDVGVTWLHSLLSVASSVTLDVQNGKMYWTVPSSIRRANLDESGVEELVSYSGYPDDIALDVANGKMYWTDADTGKIQRANLDGTDVEDVVTGLDFPDSITLDLANAKMYWTDPERDAVQRANLDGSDVEDLLLVDMDVPPGVAFFLPGDGEHLAQSASEDEGDGADVDRGTARSGVGERSDVDSASAGTATAQAPEPGRAVPGRVTGPSPDDNAVNVASTTGLEWSATEGATSYLVYFGTDAIPDSGEYRGEVSTTSYDPGPLEPETTYYWRIDSKNASGEVTTGDVWYFTTGPPVPCQVRGGIPVDGLQIDIIDDVTLVWTRACHATGYVVYFGTNRAPDTNDGAYSEETEYSVGNLDAGTTYYWRVNARNAAGETRGEVWSFSTPLPLPEAVTSGLPRHGEVDVSVESNLRWPAAPHAARYLVYWSQRGVLFDLVVETSEPWYDPGPLEHDSTYRWRIDTRNATGRTRGTTFRFTTESERPASRASGESPVDGAADVSRRTALRWSVATGATAYRVYVGTDPEPDSNPGPFNEYRGELESASYAPGPLRPDTTYYWRIDTKNASGEVTTGEVWEFRTELAEATNPRPRDDAAEVGTNAELRWSPVAGATSYDVYLGTGSTLGSNEYRGEVSETTYDPTSLDNGATYYWRIDAKNARGVTRGEVWQFRTCGIFSTSLSCLFSGR